MGTNTTGGLGLASGSSGKRVVPQARHPERSEGSARACECVDMLPALTRISQPIPRSARDDALCRYRYGAVRNVLSEMIRFPFSPVDRTLDLVLLPRREELGRYPEAPGGARDESRRSTCSSSSCSMMISTCSASGAFHSTTASRASTTTPPDGENVGAGGKWCDSSAALARQPPSTVRPRNRYLPRREQRQHLLRRRLRALEPKLGDAEPGQAPRGLQHDDVTDGRDPAP